MPPRKAPSRRNHKMSQPSNPAFTVFMQAIDTGDLPGLGPEVRSSAQPSAALCQAVGALGLSGESAGLAKAAALLWHDHLDESHTVSQDIGSADGSFLHGIMHRREPDYPNAKYWFRRVGDHPCFSTPPATRLWPSAWPRVATGIRSPLSMPSRRLCATATRPRSSRCGTSSASSSRRSCKPSSPSLAKR